MPIQSTQKTAFWQGRISRHAYIFAQILIFHAKNIRIFEKYDFDGVFIKNTTPFPLSQKTPFEIFQHKACMSNNDLGEL